MKMPLKLTVLFMICMTTFESINAQDCAVKQDPFTNEEVKSFNFKNETIVLEQIKDVITMKLKFNLDGEINIAIKSGSQLLLKTESGKILNLETIEDAIPVSQVSGTRIISVVIFTCVINEEMLKNLEESRVVFIRHPNGKGNQSDIEVPKALGKGFQEGAECMLTGK